MEMIRVPRVMQDTCRRAALRGRSIGFVPTMGALHEGHMGLMRASKGENDLTAASIFVNPSQFGPGEDFDRYPRDLDADKKMLAEADVDLLFLPDAASMYPGGFQTGIDVKNLSDKLCGAFRPGHFEGVATVVAKLLNIVGPSRAYFGQKDYQQCLIIRRLVADLNMPVEIVMCPTVREPGGLAISSRNRYLNEDERRVASKIYQALSLAAERIKSGGSAADAKKKMDDVLQAEPLITEIQYAGVYDPLTLVELSEIKGETLLAAAVKMGGTRLIDNLLV